MKKCSLSRWRLLYGRIAVVVFLTTLIDWRFGAAIHYSIGLFFQGTILYREERTGFGAGVLDVIGILVLWIFLHRLGERVYLASISSPRLWVFSVLLVWQTRSGFADSGYRAFRRVRRLSPGHSISNSTVFLDLAYLAARYRNLYALHLLQKGEKTVKKPIAGLFFTLLFCLAAGILYAGGPEESYRKRYGGSPVIMWSGNL